MHTLWVPKTCYLDGEIRTVVPVIMGVTACNLYFYCSGIIGLIMTLSFSKTTYQSFGRTTYWFPAHALLHKNPHYRDCSMKSGHIFSSYAAIKYWMMSPKMQ